MEAKTTAGDREDCSGDTPYWSNNANRCVECFSNAHCGEKEVCGDWWECEAVECTEDEHCSGSTPYCDNDNECVECYKNSHCDDPKECEDGECVGPECTDNEHCPSSKPYCDDEECVECYENDHCPGLEMCENNECVEGDIECKEHNHCPSDRPYCWSNECVECYMNQHCDDPKECEDGECVGPECTDNEHCNWRKPYCWNEECVECRISDTDCPGLKVCVDHVCVKGDIECKDNDDCTSWQRPYCWNSECVECKNNDHCDDPKECVDNKCSGPECTDSTHCPPSKPYCWERECVKCILNSHCPSGVNCREDHTCEGGFECETGEECPPSTPYCNEDGKCVKCLRNEHCEEGGNCRHGICTSGCETKYDCKRGYRCADGWCVKMECGTVANPECPTGQWCDDGLCRLLTGAKCETWRECADGYWCNPDTNKCEMIACKEHSECAVGMCCVTRQVEAGGIWSYVGKCVPCEKTTCYRNSMCAEGWYCDKEISKCRSRECDRHSDCEEGYYCDRKTSRCVPMPETKKKIDLGDEEMLSAHPCRVGHDTDCRRGQVCIGYPVSLLKRILSPQAANGYCGKPDDLLIKITGIDDEKTCDYCRALIGNMWPQSQITLPPYHENCRCDYEFV